MSQSCADFRLEARWIGQAPDPDVGIEQEAHSAQRLPFALSLGGGDDISDNLDGASHRSDPGASVDRRRRLYLGYRDAPLRHQYRHARLMHALQDGETGCLEFRYGYLFHGLLLL